MRFTVFDDVQRVRVHLRRFGLVVLGFPVRPPVDHPGAGENTGQGVVVFHGDGVKLVVVTARARNREAHERARHGIYAVFPFVGHHVEPSAVVILRAETEKAERGEVLRVCGLHFVCGQLELDKPVVRQVAVERGDDPLAILVGVRVEEFRVTADLISLILRVTRQRKPQAGHALPEPRGGQQPFHQALVGFIPFVLQIGLHLFRRRRQSGEIKRGTADQRAFAGFNRRR